MALRKVFMPFLRAAAPTFARPILSPGLASSSSMRMFPARCYATNGKSENGNNGKSNNEKEPIKQENGNGQENGNNNGNGETQKAEAPKKDPKELEIEVRLHFNKSLSRNVIEAEERAGRSICSG